MKLQKALKLRKKLIGEIADLKRDIMGKNSFMEGSLNPTKYNVPALYEDLKEKVNTLVNLKLIINEANREIQARIYQLSEYKGMIQFWKSVNVTEGTHPVSVRFGESSFLKEYVAQVTEEERNKYIEEFQKKVDEIQEEIDTYNYTTDVQWDEKPLKSDKEVL